ncbi:MAG: response regulator [Desulfatirhabdiaceae bacterium]
MTEEDERFFKRLQATFRVEAQEHLRVIAAGLLELEKRPEPPRGAEVIETVFREAHSLKGAARSVDLRDIESICQPLEGAFAMLKHQELTLSPALYDLFHQSVDHISNLISFSVAERTASDQSRTRELIGQLGKISREDALQITAEPPELAADPLFDEVLPSRSAREVQAAPYLPGEDKLILAETVRIPTARLDPLLLQAEEMTLAKISAAQRAVELQEIKRICNGWKTESKKYKDRPAAGRSPDWDEWLEWNETQVDTLQDRVTFLTQALEQDQRALKRMVDEHLEAMKEVLMLPAAFIVEAFPRFARDLARDQGKAVELTIRGMELEIDKRILEELKDPLIHLIRNCVDHGIEKAEERRRRGKPLHGTISLTFSARDSREAEILVSDDGAGIDLTRVRAAAIKAGIVPPEAAEKLDSQDTLALIFPSGISTSSIITDISGRGLGLAIVREKVEKLGGVVTVNSQTQAGTTFRLLLPLTLATFRGVLVRVGAHLFVLPTINIERAARIQPQEIKTVENRETVHLDGQIVSTVRLADALDLPVRKNGSSTAKDAAAFHANTIPVVVLASADKRIAFQVDEILEEQQILVKGLGRQLKRVRNIAGAAVLGNGKVASVLNVPDVMKSAVRSVAADMAADTQKMPDRSGKILVAEDSITARTLLKNILETAGYHVATAVDGVDAFTQLRSSEFDIVVSDVDMPRMNGFELTTRIRSDKNFEDLPVVLVTALESREDRERGIDAGANAYIVKSSFDQSNLLEVVRRLI